MSNNLVIAQVADIHIGESKVSYRGIDARQQFLNVLQVLQKKPLDLLVLGGDLAAIEGEPESYAWLKQALTTFPHPYIVMAGNHDHVMRMQRTFNLPASDISQGMLFFSRTVKERHLLFLDSSPYHVPKLQLEWLSTLLTNNTTPTLLFMHLPPARC